MSLPQHMRADDPTAADPARRRLLQMSSYSRFPSFPSRRTSKPEPNIVPLISPDPTSDDIYIDDTHLPVPNDDKDIYRWATLYENQRGITLFSTPFYSPLSLFLFDPQPFTVPNSPTARAHQPNLTLENYPLPDGTWRWASGAWMIDMRTERGEVQHDGFEYNWSFRYGQWRPNVGKFSTGAWVRRRRWVRLMMRPADHHTHTHSTPDVASATDQTAVFSSSSLARPVSNISLADPNHRASHVWDGSEQDWQHVHRLLRLLGRDGRKLELWRVWLGPFAQMQSPNIKGKEKQSDPLPPSPRSALQNRLLDAFPDENPPPLVHLEALLRSHGETIFHSFVFPESRAQFVDLVRRVGLWSDLERGLGHTFSSSDVDFWSYADDLNKPLDKGRDGRDSIASLPRSGSAVETNAAELRN